MDEQIKKLLTRRNIFIVLGVIIAVELIWAGWFLVNSAQSKPTPTPSVITKPVAPPTAVTLTSLKTEYKKGEKITVAINISSSKKVDGVDLIITYDPKVLSAQPATLGIIFSDYPQNTADATLGKVSVSGITTRPGGVIPEGNFGTISFVAKTAGVTKIAFDFTPGQTVDTNVIESGTGKDILEKVNQLELNIAQ